MPAIGGRSGLLFYCLLSALLAAGNAAAQDAAYFSPTFAASRGSPYSEVYAATFGARTVGAPPLETAAPTVVVPTLVYRSEEHTSELQSLMRLSYAIFCLK